MELDTLDGLILDCEVEGVAGRYRFEAGRLHRMEDGEIFVSDAFFTACGCGGRVPAWSVAARFVRITPDAKVRYRRAWFQLGRKRVLPIPPGYFDAVTGKASGLMMPEIRIGGSQPFSIGFPVYIATSRNTDLTITPTYVDLRGFLLGSEFRYATAPGQGGQISLSGLNE